ncbi:2-amino-4-hydroxy-6-hydroxymethyldihydropteridine diphosphokinase [Hydrogenimonas sp.]
MSESDIFSTPRFPARFTSHGMRHRAIVGIGGNIGDVADRFARVVDYLNHGGVARVLATSPLLKNPPFGYSDQPDFLNGVIVMETALSAHSLMRYLLWVEKRFGRKRVFRNGPRTVDLDIIFYDQLRIRTRRLVLPHPHFHERDSVMIPLRLLKDGSV